MNCNKCDLSLTRRTIVQGRGVLPCRTMLIGEGPGLAEDVLGEAFVGPSGQLLDSMLDEVGIDVEECYYTNVVFCHPTDEPRGKNREPRAEEVLCCMPNVMDIIRRGYPKQIVFVGQIAYRYYAKIFYEFPSVRMIHPAALLRGGGRSDPRYITAIRALAGLQGQQGRTDGNCKKNGPPPGRR